MNIETLSIIEKLELDKKKEQVVIDLITALEFRHKESLYNDRKWYQKRIDYWKEKYDNKH